MSSPSAALSIEPLGLHPSLIKLTCEWHVPEFDPGGDMDFWLRARHREATLGGVPCAWIAFDRHEPIGSVSLIDHNMDTRRDLSPWLAALFVLPNRRHQGIGSALVARCEQEARRSGYGRLFLYTEVAEGFYERLGWEALCDDHYEGQDILIMSKTLEDDSS